MTEGSGASPLPLLAGRPVATQSATSTRPGDTGHVMNEDKLTHGSEFSNSIDPKHLPSRAGLDSSLSDTLSQDKVANTQELTASIISKQNRQNNQPTCDPNNDTLGVTKQQQSSNIKSQVSNGASGNKNVEQTSTRSSSTSSYIIVSGIEGRRVDSGYNSVGGGDQVLRTTEGERKAPIAEITEFSITPEEGSETSTPEFIFTSATPPSLPQSSLADEINSESPHLGQTEQRSVKSKPANLTLTEDGHAVGPPVTSRGLVSSHDSLSPRRLRPKTIRRKHTVSGVTEEARAVLEQLLRRSYSQNDASPRSTLQSEYMGISEMTVIEELPKQPTNNATEEKPLKSPRSPMIRNKSYQAATGHLASGSTSGPPQKSDSFDFMCDDDDDLTSHSPVSKTNSIVSGSSRSSSFRNRYVVRPLPTQDVEAALKGNLKKKTKVKRRPRKDSTGSTSSGSDYGAFDDGVRRKNSFFKRASERLRQSFRIKKERHKDLDDLSDTDKNKVQHKKRKSPKSKKSHRDTFPRSPSDPSGGDDIVHTHLHRHIHQEQNKVGNGNILVLHTEDIDVVQDSKDDHHVEVKLQTKESWPKEKEKRSLWDNILQKMRKGSHKLQRKGSSKGMMDSYHQRNTIVFLVLVFAETRSFNILVRHTIRRITSRKQLTKKCPVRSELIQFCSCNDEDLRILKITWTY